MRNFKDIIIEKLKVTKNYSEFTWDEFINALYKYDDHHDLWFEDLPNINGYDDLPEFEYDGKSCSYRNSINRGFKFLWLCKYLPYPICIGKKAVVTTNTLFLYCCLDSRL